MDIIDRAQLANERASVNKVPYCICGSKRRSTVSLRSTALADEQLLIVALSKGNVKIKGKFYEKFDFSRIF